VQAKWCLKRKMPPLIIFWQNLHCTLLEFLSTSIPYCHPTLSLLPLIVFLDAIYPTVQESFVSCSSIICSRITNMHVVSYSSIHFLWETILVRQKRQLF
jgi:hypothetical protein